MKRRVQYIFFFIDSLIFKTESFCYPGSIYTVTFQGLGTSQTIELIMYHKASEFLYL